MGEKKKKSPGIICAGTTGQWMFFGRVQELRPGAAVGSVLEGSRIAFYESSFVVVVVVVINGKNIPTTGTGVLVQPCV